ncbi:hypothetical protein [Actinoplanes sp. NPDC049802]|uniref:hypothetical protein n=1 Tax=Actinoplanes sp. NPDC049802 TaxID=3154742 RepID=UPI0033DB03E7
MLVDVAAVVALYTLATLRDRRGARRRSTDCGRDSLAAGGLFDLANLVPANYALNAVRRRPAGQPAPAPSLAEIGALLDGFRQAGYDIRVTHNGTAQLLGGAGDLAAYRVVQEALTNAGEHGTARRAEVGDRWPAADSH